MEANPEGLDKVWRQIQALVLPADWKQDGVEPPNDIAKKTAYECCLTLFNKTRLLPSVIACTKENGVYMTFVGGKKLIVEAYNDGEIGALINDDSKKVILYNEDILNSNLDRCIKKFI